LFIKFGTTLTPPILRLNVLLKFLGKPVPVIVIVVPPSGVPLVGVIDVIVSGTFYPVTPLTNE
jgi:hypothetical protein